MSLSYLIKFNELPKELKEKINAPTVVARVGELEKEFSIDLAATIMKVMVREVRLEALGAYLINDLGLTADKATMLEKHLRRSVFVDVIDYLLGADKGPKLVFHETDEKEAKAAATASKEVSTQDFDTLINSSTEEIAKQSRINFSDPLAGGKFRQVLKTYLRGSRDKIATFEALTKASELGGVALSRDTADRVLIIAENFLPKVSKAAVATPKIKLPEEKAMPVLATRDADYNLEAVLKSEGRLKPASKPEPTPPPILDTSHELMPPPPAIMPEVPTPESRADAPVPETVPAAAPNENSEKKPSATRQALRDIVSGVKSFDREKLRELTSSPAVAVTVNNQLKSASGKIKMDDIRFTPRTLSPIDELRSLTLKNFRRLSPNPVQATEKIREKMEMLGREDYGKKIEAITAWHQSPLNRLYLEVGRRSLEENLPVLDVLKRELKSQSDFLKPEELEAIINLNRILKF